MKLLILILILFASGSLVFGQAPGKLVFWSGDENCGQKSRSITPDDKFRCVSVPTERGPVSTITHNDITLSVAFLEEDDYNIVGARITNDSSDPIFFDSDMWGAAHFKTKEDFQQGRKPLVAETSIPSREILILLASGARMERSLTTFISDNQKTQESKEVRRADGTRYRIDVTVPDKQAQENTARQNAARSEMVMSEQRRIRETALTAKSVRGKQTLKGLVYFRQVNNADFVVFSFSIDGTTYVFQLPRAKKK